LIVSHHTALYGEVNTRWHCNPYAVAIARQTQQNVHIFVTVLEISMKKNNNIAIVNPNLFVKDYIETGAKYINFPEESIKTTYNECDFVYEKVTQDNKRLTSSDRIAQEFVRLVNKTLYIEENVKRSMPIS
jgi:hypothetical protein